ncbi:MAG: hypothetical protein JWP89_7021 [Schlesneria sp.]|nr:hypothetical protein [Schlesneria sp.]
MPFKTSECATAIDTLSGPTLRPMDRALLEMVDRLAYTIPEAATLLEMTHRTARRRYWRARRMLQPKKPLREILSEMSPKLLERDHCALELVEVLEYSIGRAAKVLNINKGHLCRRLAIARALIHAAGDPRVE